jgi:hypothetical protein
MFLFVLYNVRSCEKNIFSSINNFDQNSLCDINHEINKGMLLI